VSTSGELIGAVDFGARSIRVLIGRTDESGTIQVIGHGRADSHGCVSQGVIQDLHAAQRALAKALRDAEKEARGQVRSIFCGVQGRNVETHIREGIVELDDETAEQYHLDEAREKALADLDTADKRITSSVTAQEWYVNDLRVKNPLGIRGELLRTRIHVACLPAVIEDNLITCIESQKRYLEDVIFLPLAGALGTMTPEDMELGAAVIDIGCRNTGLAVYRDYRIMGTHCFEWGGYHITRDVAAGLHIGFDEADELIEQYGIPRAALAEDEDPQSRSVLQEDDRAGKIKLKSAVPEAPDIIERSDLEMIIYERAREMLHRLRKHLQSRDLEKHLVRGIILTGGGSALKNMPSLSETVFGRACRSGVPVNVDIVPHGVASPVWAPAVGILRHAVDYREALQRGGRNGGAMGRLRGLLAGGVRRYFW